jgi:signal transduction histidine kinase
VSDFEREHGTEAHLRVEGKTLELAPAARLAIYRAAEEALANLGTHAPTGQVEVRLRYRADGAELTVESDAGSLRPPGSDEQSRPPSTGGPLLDGVRERAELLGGHLEIAHTEQGFRVRLWLPTVGREYYPEGLRDEIPASAARERGDTEAALNRQS